MSFHLDNDYIDEISLKNRKRHRKVEKTQNNEINVTSSSINGNINSNETLVENLIPVISNEIKINEDNLNTFKSHQIENPNKIHKLKIPDCSICREYLTHNLTVITVCGHIFHKICIEKWFTRCTSDNHNNNVLSRLTDLNRNHHLEQTCPLCRVPCSILTLCDIVNLTIDNILVDNNEDNNLILDIENKNLNHHNSLNYKSTNICLNINCHLKIQDLNNEYKQIKEEFSNTLKNLEKLNKKNLLLNDSLESLERNNLILRDDLARVTHELAEINQKYMDMNKEFTQLQAQNTLVSFLNDTKNFNDEDQIDSTDGIYQLSLLIGFNPFEQEDIKYICNSSNNKNINSDMLTSLKVVSQAFIKLKNHYDTLRFKYGEIKSKFYQLKESNKFCKQQYNKLQLEISSLKRRNNECLTGNLWDNNKKDILSNNFNNNNEINQEYFDELSLDCISQEVDRINKETIINNIINKENKKLEIPKKNSTDIINRVKVLDRDNRRVNISSDTNESPNIGTYMYRKNVIKRPISKNVQSLSTFFLNKTK
ncbi:zinc finger, C3HC4 type domain-containing protein [Cryptosporidium muris RN66]|uniref:Zinc finger, C3HC4 type domain-containing protein n=1 Tax=Cryptosporidium muris (strain RN66) TaxID=441375 RepID=B6AGK1_CRYMR|nr:zinc finger, C3HC4 type domain-containing protein [Cryptosporidium muris RN66]EEA07342.1 zinc finger, C3HC4 type domain-containing protein [Cryptosporidium muris RN66]|eukprot:XP_002141691.1 zinc finger, C3HC4 type domain-containing protein [Cryptosporidium muris RN66]